MTTQPTLMLLGGVPGAGKTRALQAIERRVTGVRICDSDRVRRRLTSLLPRVPYRLLRPAVHAIAELIVLIRLLHPGGGPLLIHSPGTRRFGRMTIVRLARRLGRSPIAVFIDVSREEALRGQVGGGRGRSPSAVYIDVPWAAARGGPGGRGRVARARAFDRHWRRWLDLRRCLVEGRSAALPGEPWELVRMTTRHGAAVEVLGALGERQPFFPPSSTER